MGFSDAVLMSGLLPTMVSPGLVLDGLICTRLALLEMGSSASATLELKGPMTPSTEESPASSVMFCAPCCGSCLPSATEESSLATNLTVQPPSSLLLVAWVTASCAPFWVGLPSDASLPLTGRSEATVTLPVQDARPPPPPDDGPVVLLDVPQPASTAKDTAPRMGTSRIWVRCI